MLYSSCLQVKRACKKHQQLTSKTMPRMFSSVMTPSLLAHWKAATQESCRKHMKVRNIQCKDLLVHLGYTMEQKECEKIHLCALYLCTSLQTIPLHIWYTYHPASMCIRQEQDRHDSMIQSISNADEGIVDASDTYILSSLSTTSAQ